MLEIVGSYHCMQFQGKLMIQTQENGKKPDFRPDIGLLGPNSGREMFFKYLASSVTRYHGQLSSCTIPEKTNNRWTDRPTDRWTDRWRTVIS